MAGQAPPAVADHSTGLQAEGDECLVHYMISVPSTHNAFGRELLQASRTCSWDQLLSKTRFLHIELDPGHAPFFFWPGLMHA